MRRVEVHLDEELDRRLEALAAEQGVSKASLIRRAVEKELAPFDAVPDPIPELIGAFDGPPADSVDDFVYR